jgi:hypothetical protein
MNNPTPQPVTTPAPRITTPATRTVRHLIKSIISFYHYQDVEPLTLVVEGDVVAFSYRDPQRGYGEFHRKARAMTHVEALIVAKAVAYEMGFVMVSITWDRIEYEYLAD